uniref:FTP domain-containing protein n=1 Tax=Macrostomum lignano TaxID=282301 RepID=A0A1I8HUV8_9PLAT
AKSSLLNFLREISQKSTSDLIFINKRQTKMVSEGWLLLLAVCLLHVLSQAHSYRYIGCFVDKEKNGISQYWAEAATCTRVSATGSAATGTTATSVCSTPKSAGAATATASMARVSRARVPDALQRQPRLLLRLELAQQHLCNHQAKGLNWSHSPHRDEKSSTADSVRTRLPLSKCSQHSVDFNGKCSRAIDGDTNQNYRKKSCTHTRTATGAWWQARTSRRARITSVRIYNRQDCCANRLRNFVIKVDGQVCASYHSSSAFSVKTFRCNAVGRTVRIETRNRVPLTLCEVKVYGRYAEVSTEFLGCYPDDSEFPDFIVAKVSALMTVWKCNKICKAKKFSYFGVKNGQICGCGNEYGNSARHCQGQLQTWLAAAAATRTRSAAEHQQ